MRQKTAHAHQFIHRLPQGYETMLGGERGEQIDIGQAFLLALARVAFSKPALLIIEEPPVKLDDDTKNLVDDAYSRIFAGRTVMILPTRLSTIKKADRLIVFNQGKIEVMGRHADLVKSNAVYRHWEYLHFNEFRPEPDTAD